MSNYNDVMMVKIIGGEFIIGCFKEETDDYIELSDARTFQIQMTHSGAAIALPPVFPFGTLSTTDMKISKNHIIVTAKGDEIDKEISNAYMSHISGLDLSMGKPNLVVPNKF